MDLIQNLVGGDRRNLVTGFAMLLSLLEQAGKLQQMVPPAGNRQRGQDSFASGEEVNDAPRLDESLLLAGSPLDRVRDTFSSYEEKALADGRLLRRYESGSVRLLNPKSDVIQEETPGGQLTISMPDGKVIFQENPGHPLMLFDTKNVGRPRVVRVVMVKVGAAKQATPAFTFTDDEATYLVDMNTLDYHRVARNQGQTQQAPVGQQLLVAAA